jgi:hypothetical protein
MVFPVIFSLLRQSSNPRVNYTAAAQAPGTWSKPWSKLILTPVSSGPCQRNIFPTRQPQCLPFVANSAWAEGTHNSAQEENAISLQAAVVLRSGAIVFDGRSSDLKRKEDLWSWF